MRMGRGKSPAYGKGPQGATWRLARGRGEGEGG